MALSEYENSREAAITVNERTATSNKQQKHRQKVRKNIACLFTDAAIQSSESYGTRNNITDGDKVAAFALARWVACVS